MGASRMSEVMIRWLTLVGIGGTTLTSLWFFGRKLFGYLAQLEELPEIKKSLTELKDQNNRQHVDNQRRFTALETQTLDSNKWHDDHLAREHNTPLFRRRERPGEND
jgi:hypothetical protein